MTALASLRPPSVNVTTPTAILSRLPKNQQEAILASTQLDPITPYTETDPAVLMARIRAAAEKGYAIIANETVLGNISVASPILNEHGVAVAAINIPVPTTRWTVERVEAELAQQVQVAATSISRAKFTPYL